MTISFRRGPLATLALLFGVAACGADSDGTATDKDAGGDQVGGAGGQDDTLFGTGGSGGAGGGQAQGGGSADLCAALQCSADKHCEVVSGSASCVDNACADLICTATEKCEIVSGGGAICADNTCSDNIECAESEFCNGTICVADVCSPAARSCTGSALKECMPDGSAEITLFSCGGSAYFTSACVDAGGGVAGCTCEDDWDCPSNTVCEAGTCAGSGQPASCLLAPQPFSMVLPAPEIEWGGKSIAQPDATTSPFAASAQVVMTPLVANLDDDNGDGSINELDVPEVIFTSFCPTGGVNLHREFGVLRAIHGGGVNKGKDFFASCGATTWHEGQAIGGVACGCKDGEADAPGDLNSTASLAAGDLDGDGVPEIVGIVGSGIFEGRVRIYDNTGEIVATSGDFQSFSFGPPITGEFYENAAPAIANVDHAGLAEIVVGRHVFTLSHDAGGKLQFVDEFIGGGQSGKNLQGPVPCIADLNAAHVGQEIVAGSTVYALPAPPAGASSRSDCGANPPSNVEEQAFCDGNLLEIWDGQTVNGATLVPDANRDGYCAVADVLAAGGAVPGPGMPLDGMPEVVLVSSGRILLFGGATGTLHDSLPLGTGDDGGGPPNVDDFDGDGFPEIGVAGEIAYVMTDLQATSAACPSWPEALIDGAGLGSNSPRTPQTSGCSSDSDCTTTGTTCNEALGACVCLHNGWKRATEDDSSRETGSSVFDFNGDGAAEVVYNDECHFRIYSGLDGKVELKEPSPSRTRIEYPVVADVDNDGNAEIIFPTSNESGFCSLPGGNDHNNGIEVWGDLSDSWVPARRIWNQHAYHVTNVTEGGAIPVHPPESWRAYAGRSYNLYRSNPRTNGIAPDLTVAAVQVSSPDAACGQLSTKLEIAIQIDNLGDVRVGPGVVIGLDGLWTNPSLDEPLAANAGGTPLVVTLQNAVEPGGSVWLTVTYDSANNTRGMPEEIRVTVDSTDKERECQEDNNERTVAVQPGQPLPDLSIVLSSASAVVCAATTVNTTVFNLGSVAVSNVRVRYYAGDPTQGGLAIHDEVIAGPIAAGASHQFVATMSLSSLPPNAPIRIVAIVDPDDEVVECNDGNNSDDADNNVICQDIN